MSSLSLIPYSPTEGREVVLRHRNAIILRNPATHRLAIRLLPTCPTCHQPLPPGLSIPSQTTATPGHSDFPDASDPFVDPDYFRLLRAGAYFEYESSEHPSSSEDGHPIGGGGGGGGPDDDPEHARRYSGGMLVAGFSGHHQRPGQSHRQGPPEDSRPSRSDGGRNAGIRASAFSPNYFSTFFTETQQLGRGARGTVHLVRHTIDGLTLGHFALKRIPVGNDHAWLEKTLSEVNLLAALSHPNLVSYRHVWLEDWSHSRFGPRVPTVFILQQFCNGGDLLKYVLGKDAISESSSSPGVGAASGTSPAEQLKARVRRRRQSAHHPKDPPPPPPYLSLPEIYRLFRDITAGLVYLHANAYIHRDLKPSNCLLHRDTSLRCLISDFGEVQHATETRLNTGTTGTISYCAPEVLRRDAAGKLGPFTERSDVWSLGMILHFMCFRRLPFVEAAVLEEDPEDVDLLRREILTWQGFQEAQRERPELPPKLYRLIATLLSPDPNLRPSAAEVLAAIQDEAAGSSPAGSFSRVQPIDTPAPSTSVSVSVSPERRNPFAISSGRDSPRSDVRSRNNVMQRVQEDNNSRGGSIPRNTGDALVLARQGNNNGESSRGRDRAFGSHSPVLRNKPLLLPAPTGDRHISSTRYVMPSPSHQFFGSLHNIILGIRYILFLIKILTLSNASTATAGVAMALAGIALQVPVYRWTWRMEVPFVVGHAVILMWGARFT